MLVEKVKKHKSARSKLFHCVIIPRFPLAEWVCSPVPPTPQAKWNPRYPFRDSHFFLIIFTYAKLFYSTDTKNEPLSIIIILVVWKSNENCYDDSEALNRRQSLDYAVNPPSIFYNSQKKKIRKNPFANLPVKRTIILFPKPFSASFLQTSSQTRVTLVYNQCILVSEWDCCEWEIP